MAKKLYPGQANAYETILYEKLTRAPDPEEHKIKFDEPNRKLLTRETIACLGEHEAELQSLFEIYLSENYNSGLDFGWEEVKVLEKKLPIICLLRMLNEAEVIPNCLTPGNFLELLVKLRPPTMPNSTNASSKEVMFYSAETMSIYIRDYAHLPTIRLSEGDSGVTFLEFQLLMARIANELNKDTKSDTVVNLRKLFKTMKLKEAFDSSVLVSNRMAESVRKHLQSTTVHQEKAKKMKNKSENN